MQTFLSIPFEKMVNQKHTSEQVDKARKSKTLLFSDRLIKWEKLRADFERSEVYQDYVDPFPQNRYDDSFFSDLFNDAYQNLCLTLSTHEPIAEEWSRFATYILDGSLAPECWGKLLYYYGTACVDIFNNQSVNKYLDSGQLYPMQLMDLYKMGVHSICDKAGKIAFHYDHPKSVIIKNCININKPNTSSLIVIISTDAWHPLFEHWPVQRYLDKGHSVQKLLDVLEIGNGLFKFETMNDLLEHATEKLSDPQ